MRWIAPLSVALLLLSPHHLFAATTTPATQRASAFFPPHIIERIRANASSSEWGRSIRQQSIAQAEPWMRMSDDQLARLMFASTIPRSWHVFSNGHCPACEKSVPMYDWKIDALATPWKVCCPHCKELFPKNDFAKFHDSGLDENGFFNPAKANRKLLFNADHPDPKDPLHTFGVDDGAGYASGDKRWRFVSTYLVYGQWKQAVLLGIKRLSAAYVLTGDATYAHKAAILLDRVAQVYPTFDFKTQGILYESVRADGYVSVWHDSTIETREMALAYDAIKPALTTPIRNKPAADVATNIEQRILRDALANEHKIYSNYPQQYLTSAIIHTALAWPANRDQVLALLDPVIAQSTSVDGTTGEKGLANYSAYAAQRLAEFLGYYTRIDDRFLPEMVKRHPRLPQMWRFFIDTWCADQKYYPLSGDSMYVAASAPGYEGVAFLKDHGIGVTGHMGAMLGPSMYSFLFQLYAVSKDPAFVQVLHRANESKLDGLPYDLFLDAEAFRRDVKALIDQHGTQLSLPSINKQEWHLAILRSGKGASSRAAWLDYDAGGPHGHADGLNLGFFAKGLDLMPDFGYPPVQYGGWSSPRARWYTSTAAHNTVLVNGADQPPAAGKTTLWADGEGFAAISASAPGLNPGVTRFERTIAMIDISADDSYLVDIFRVAGGNDHAKFFHSHFGTLTPSSDLSMQPATDFAHPQMRNFQVARTPKPGWSVTWNIEDRYKLLPAGSDVRLRYTDFTSNADAYACEAWIVAGYFNAMTETYLPRVMVRRKSPADPSTFVSVIEPFDTKSGPLIKSMRRLPLPSDSSVAMQIDLSNGSTDLLISNDTETAVTDPENHVTTNARLAMLRRDATGRRTMMALCEGTILEAASVKLELKQPGFVQLRLNPDGSATVVRGTPDQVKSISANGQSVTIR